MEKDTKAELGSYLRPYDVIGIGIGPANLSLAALLEQTGLTSIFFDSASEFNWHLGMLLPESELQVHYLKDCVSLIDPTNPYSFLNYLATSGRIYQFMNRKTEIISRKEFNLYYRWVVSCLKNLFFSHKVESITLENGFFNVKTNNKNIYGINIVCGTGQTPFVPENFKNLLSEHVFHTAEYCFKKNEATHQHVAVIGGGQSGAEVVYDLLKTSKKLSSLTWASSRLNFQPIDNSCFANEYFTPNYSHYFYHLPESLREALLKEQLLASDGISQNLLDDIYRLLYQGKYVERLSVKYNLLTHHKLVEIKPHDGGYQLIFNNLQLKTTFESFADKVIFATGYHPSLPDFMAPLNPLMERDHNNITIGYDCALKIKTTVSGSFYFNNLTRHTHGISDLNLSLLAWSNAKIINSILGHSYYRLYEQETLMRLREHTFNEKYVSLAV